MHEPTGRSPATDPPPARSGRCSIHSTSPRVGTCAGCARALCLACAIPVRGVLVGAECLTMFVEDAPPVDPPRRPGRHSGDLLAIAGFAVVAILSLFPWSRFGGSGFLSAWTGSWSLLASLAGVVGLALAVTASLRPRSPQLESGVYTVMSMVTGAAALLYRTHPPLLAGASVVPIGAFGGAVLALFGGTWKVVGVLRGVAHRR